MRPTLDVRGRLWRRSKLIRLLLDMVVWLAAIPLAFYLRVDKPVGAWWSSALVLMLVAAPTIRMCILGFRLDHQSWSHTGLQDALLLGWAVATGSIALTILIALLDLFLPLSLPRSIPIIAGTLALAGMGTLRLGLRAWRERAAGAHTRVLIAGTDANALLFARSLAAEKRRLVGFLDDDLTRRTISFLGKPVYGSTQEIDAILDGNPVDEVVIGYDPGSEPARRVEAACHRNNVRCRFLSAPHEMLYGRLQRADAKGEGLSDLLRREVQHLDLEGIRRILAGQCVLVTGAGGSIGSEVAHQVAAFGPETLLILSHDENSIFELEASLRRKAPQTKVRMLVADIKDRRRIEALFAQWRPNVVFHAAAHKHVPLMEEHPTEAVANNVGGTRNLLDLAVRHGVGRFVNISTDKAVHPTNVMGCTKFIGEMLVRQAARRAPGSNFVSVRFGNVLGSRGSVIPTWERQLREGGPVTITDERMTRFFMLIPEAVQLVLQAAEFGGAGTTYVLDMGQPVRIRDLADQLIRLHGFVPGQDIQVLATGLRPGEKLYEELLLSERGTTPSPHEKILVEGDVPLPGDLDERLDRLLAAAAGGDAAAVRAQLQELVPGARLTA